MKSRNSSWPGCAAWCALALLWATPARAQLDFEREPISYYGSPLNDRISRLLENVDSGRVELEWDERHGWLPSLLEHLQVPKSSQTLVFSKTSLQLSRITPSRPRALYFSDDVYVGWVQQGDVVELSAVDPRQGAVFYTIAQRAGERPEFRRDQGECMSCHASSRTKDVPGYLVRSVFAGGDGRPHFGLGTTTTDHATPFEERFGGWYVTGQHGDMRHRGNVIAEDDRQHPIDPELGANCQVLPPQVRASDYLRPTSDLVALMVLEHQSQMHNLVTRASYEARQALHYDQIMNLALNRAADFRSESAQRRIASVSENVVKYMLFSGEYQLTSPVRGESSYAVEFAKLGPRDATGRSLREFDLERRLFRYPCSYLIYSDSIDALPDEVLQYVRRRMTQVLLGDDPSHEFAHLSREQRQAIVEILRDTKPGFLLAADQAAQ